MHQASLRKQSAAGSVGLATCRSGRQLAKASMHDAASRTQLAGIAMHGLADGSLTLAYLCLRMLILSIDWMVFSEPGLSSGLILSCHTGLTGPVVHEDEQHILFPKCLGACSLFKLFAQDSLSQWRTKMSSTGREWEEQYLCQTNSAI